MEVRIDSRLLTLSAALTAASSPAQVPENLIVAQTRERLRSYCAHPSVQWLQGQYEAVGLLGLAMQTVQLGDPPEFDSSCPEGVPLFVEEYFAEVARSELAQHLHSFWHDAGIKELLELQAPRWREIAAELSAVASRTELETFQTLFFGRFPYIAVAVPLWNMASSGLRGVGVANRRETYAVCLPGERDSLRFDLIELLILTQHEASHPVLDDVQRLCPEVPGACAFIEQAYPPGGRFARMYGDPVFRWVETVIRSSTYFYLQFVGQPAAAEAFLAKQVHAGVTAIRPFVEALSPWWHQRLQGDAPGLDGVLKELPVWLRRARI